MLRRLAAIVLAAALAACASSRTGESYDGGTGSQATRGTYVAKWNVDPDTNLATPTCAACGAPVACDATSCPRCDTGVRVEPTTITCPDCKGAKDCVHCGPKAKCVACNGTHQCPVCNGSGTFHDEKCPECDGAKACVACSPGAEQIVCDRCHGNHVCGNCGGVGTITLR